MPQFNNEEYLMANPDVAEAVHLGVFSTGEEHYKQHQGENRSLTYAYKPSSDSPPLPVDIFWVVTDLAKTEALIDTLLSYESLLPFIHLSDPNGLTHKIQNNYSVISYYMTGPSANKLDWLHALVPYSRTNKLYFTSEDITPSEDFFRYAQAANCTFSCAATHPQGVSYSTPIKLREPVLKRSLLFGATVVDKDSYIDINGVGNEGWDEFTARLQLKHKLVCAGASFVTLNTPPEETEVVNSIHYEKYRFYPQTVHCYSYGKGWEKKDRIVSDTIIVFNDSSLLQVDYVVKEMFKQKEVMQTLHLVNDNPYSDASQEYLKSCRRPYVYTYYNTHSVGVCETWNNLYPYLRSDYIVFQSPSTPSNENRISDAVHLLDVSDSDAIVQVDADQKACLESLVIKKSAYRQVRGFINQGPTSSSEYLGELVYRLEFLGMKIFKTRHPHLRSPSYSESLPKFWSVFYPLNGRLIGGLGKARNVLVPTNQSPVHKQVIWRQR